MVYKVVKLTLSNNQLQKVKRGKRIRLTYDQIKNGTHDVHLHPVQFKIVNKALKSGKGCSLHLSSGEILSTKEKGSGIFDSIWKGLKSTYNWAKQNSDVIKPVLSRIADVAIPAAATSIGAPSASIPARTLLKSTTGVGIEVPSKRRKPGKRKQLSGKSFLLN